MLKKNVRGYSLVEMLVALTITALLIAVFVSMFSSAIQRNKQALNTARLDQSMQAALSLMSADIRRAGFWGNAIAGLHTGSNPNPFNGADISISGGNCILLSYDQNGDGSLPSVGAGTDDERYGYRLLNNAIQARPSGASYSCGASANAWENVTDANVLRITALSFVQTNRVVLINSPATASMTVRSVLITLTGQLAADASVSKTLSVQVKVRNDLYTP